MMATMSEREKAPQKEEKAKESEENAGGNPLERIERLLTCPICLDRYKQPKLLSCQHTFCFSCLESYVESSAIVRPRIRCPECRAETALSDGGNVQSLPTNLTLLAFLEIHLEASDVNAAEMQAYVQRFNMERCRVCEEKAELELCAHCERKCCGECRRAHLDMLKRDLGRLLGQVRRLSSRVMDASKGLSRGLEQLSANGEQTKSEIREYFNRYQKELRRREETFIDQVDTFVQTEDRLMRTLRDALDVEWNNLQGACLWVDGALGGQMAVRDDELTRFKTVFAQALEYLRSFQPDLEEHFAKKVRFSPGDDAAKLPTAIANFGELNVSLPQFANRYLPLEQQYLPRPFRLGFESDHFLRPEKQRIGRTEQQHSPTQQQRLFGGGGTQRGEEGESQHESAGAQRWRRRRELEEEAWSRLRAESTGAGSARTSGRATPSGAASPLTIPLIGGAAGAESDSERAEKKTETNSTEKEEIEEKKGKELPKGQPKPTKMAKGTNPPEEKAEKPTTEKSTEANGAKTQTEGTNAQENEAGEDATPKPNLEEPKKEQTAKKSTAPVETVPTFTMAQTAKAADSKNGQAGGPSHQQSHRGRLLMVNGGGSSNSNISRTTATPRRILADANGTIGANESANHRKPPLPARQFSAGAENGTKSKMMKKTSGGDIDQIGTELFGRKKKDEEEEEEEEEENQKGNAEERRGSRMQIQSQSNRFRIHCRSSSHGRAKLDIGQPIPVAFFPDKSTGEWASDHSTPPLQSGLLSRSRTNPDLFAEMSASSRASLVREALEQRPRPKERRESREGMPPIIGGRREESAGRRRARRGEREGEPKCERIPMRQTSRDRNEMDDDVETVGEGVDSAMDFARLRPRPRLVLGGRGTAPDQMNWPRGICALPHGGDGTLFAVADSSNHRIQIFRGTDGTLVRTFGTFGSGNGEFDGCCAICVNGVRGELLVADRYNHRVQVFEFDGTFKLKFGCHGTGPGQFQQCWGIAVDEQFGLIYVADKDNHRIQMFDAEGAFLTKFGTMGDGARQFNHPLYLTFHPAKRLLFVSDSANNRISVFAPDGTPMRQFGGNGSAEGQLKLPRGIVVDCRGRIIVADSGNNRVQFFSPSGVCLRVFGTWGTASGQFKGVEGLCLLGGQRQRQLVIADRENNRVQLFA